jgi:hypothetical protein
MKARLLPATLVLASVFSLPAAAVPWRPSSAGPSHAAQLVLDSLPEPSSVPLPPDLGRGFSVVPSLGGLPSAIRTGGCYEVQLMATADPAIARRQTESASTALGVTAHVTQSDGLYRIRVGHCLDAGAAASLRDRARERGYSGAFIVPGSPAERSGS